MSSTADHWDQRYAGNAHFYGTEPNDFLRDNVSALPPGGRILSLGEGEGRNAVFLAARGFDVVAVDASSVGLEKATRLAAQAGVRIETVVADLEDFALGSDAWDGIVSIWCHLSRPVRARVHADIAKALRVGGTYLLESYTPAQLKFATGGPKSLDLLPTLAELRVELAALRLESAVERERDVHEGAGHGGRSAVVQVIARRIR